MKVRLTSLFEFDVIETFGTEEVNLGAERITLKALLRELAGKSKGTETVNLIMSLQENRME